MLCYHIHISMPGDSAVLLLTDWLCMYVVSLLSAAASRTILLSSVLSFLLTAEPSCSLPILTALSDVKRSLSLPHTIAVSANLSLVQTGQNSQWEPIGSLVSNSRHQDKMSNISVQNRIIASLPFPPSSCPPLHQYHKLCNTSLASILHKTNWRNQRNIV